MIDRTELWGLVTDNMSTVKLVLEDGSPSIYFFSVGYDLYSGMTRYLSIEEVKQILEAVKNRKELMLVCSTKTKWDRDTEYAKTYIYFIPGGYDHNEQKEKPSKIRFVLDLNTDPTGIDFDKFTFKEHHDFKVAGVCDFYYGLNSASKYYQENGSGEKLENALENLLAFYNEAKQSVKELSNDDETMSVTGLFRNEKGQLQIVLEDEDGKETNVDPQTTMDILDELIKDHSAEVIEGIREIANEMSLDEQEGKEQ